MLYDRKAELSPDSAGSRRARAGRCYAQKRSRQDKDSRTAMDIGAELRAAREAKGLSIRTLADRTRVPPQTLAAIELNNASALPPRPFARGFVRAFAKEVSLDPDRTVQEYFSQFPPEPAPEPAPRARRFEPVEAIYRPPSQLAGLGVAAVILLVVVGTAMYAGRRAEQPGESGAVGTSGAAVPTPGTATPVGWPAAAPSAAPSAAVAAAAAPAAPIRFEISVSQPCWVSANVDGERTLYRIVQAGERHSLTAQQEIRIRFGDAGAVSWTLNGRAGAPLGPSGAVRDLHITPDNAASIR
jgi:cytoskeleton protein RodZ